jgi:hypothetical protein
MRSPLGRRPAAPSTADMAWFEVSRRVYGAETKPDDSETS